MEQGCVGYEDDHLWDMCACKDLLPHDCVCVEKVRRESKEVHRENSMICSVQGLCIDLVYVSLLSFSKGSGILLSFPLLSSRGPR